MMKLQTTIVTLGPLAVVARHPAGEGSILSRKGAEVGLPGAQPFCPPANLFQIVISVWVTFALR